MKLKLGTWPAPPCHRGTEPPEIPERMNIFGMEYKVVNGHLALDIPSAQLDKDRIRAAVIKSYNSFSNLVATLNPENINELRNAHAEIIEAINKAIPFQEEFAINEAMEKQLSTKLDLYSKIKNSLNM